MEEKEDDPFGDLLRRMDGLKKELAELQSRVVTLEVGEQPAEPPPDEVMYYRRARAGERPNLVSGGVNLIYTVTREGKPKGFTTLEGAKK